MPVGQILATPESGWKRIEQDNPNIKYIGGNWITENGATLYSGGSHIYSSSGGSYQFYFYGSKIRIIGAKSPTGSNDVSVKVDGVQVGTYPTTTMPLLTVLFEKLDLSFGIHFVEVVNNDSTKNVVLDAIDIDVNGRFGTLNKFLILSSDRKVISHENDGVNGIVKYIPNNSEQNFINHGLDKSAQIDLNAPMTNKVLIEQSSTPLGEGKVFKKSIDISQMVIKKVEVK